MAGKDKISLIFLNGITVHDPYDLLEEDGKQGQTMRIRSEAFNQEALQNYVQQILHK